MVGWVHMTELQRMQGLVVQAYYDVYGHSSCLRSDLWEDINFLSSELDELLSYLMDDARIKESQTEVSEVRDIELHRRGK